MRETPSPRSRWLSRYRPDLRAWRGRSFERLADERGISLVLSLLVVAALSITTAALAQLVASNEHAFGRDRQARLAFNTAEAGLNYGISYLAQTTDPSGVQSTGFFWRALSNLIAVVFGRKP